jgi:hypothetical protein
MCGGSITQAHIAIAGDAPINTHTHPIPRPTRFNPEEARSVFLYNVGIRVQIYPEENINSFIPTFATVYIFCGHLVRIYDYMSNHRLQELRHIYT